MGFLHQLHLLLWKNISLKRRGPVRREIRSPDTRGKNMCVFIFFYYVPELVSCEVSWASLRPATLPHHVPSVIKHQNTAVLLLLDKVMVDAQVFTAAFSVCPRQSNRLLFGGWTKTLDSFLLYGWKTLQRIRNDLRLKKCHQKWAIKMTIKR